MWPSSAASVIHTPHSPQPKVRTSQKPPLPGLTRLRCIDLPQFGQAGRPVMPSLTGRISCLANMPRLVLVRFQTTERNSNARLRRPQAKKKEFS
jgi:hypothetical protein